VVEENCQFVLSNHIYKMSTLEISLELDEYKKLDEYALLASQEYNFGNNGNWFYIFRGGISGFRARIFGFVTHYNSVHAWVPIPRLPIETEYHLASAFFNMDSAIECLMFSLNALGHAVLPGQFRDITDDRAFRQISPKDILGDRIPKSPRLPLSGYEVIFPKLQTYWQLKREMMLLIIEQHDVSKHRETIFTGGNVRSDPPPGFYESIGVERGQGEEWLYGPMEGIILQKNPKSRHSDRVPQEKKDFVFLEDIASEFTEFIRESGKLSFQDVKSNIELKHTIFL